MICNSSDMMERKNISIQFTQTMFVSHRCGSKMEMCFSGGGVDKVSTCKNHLFLCALVVVRNRHISKVIMNVS